MLALWGKAFAMTITLETPLYILGLRQVIGVLRTLVASLLVNLVTHPLVWFVLPRLFPEQVHYALASEALAITVEALMLAGACRLLRAPPRSWVWFFGLSFLVNAASAILGQIGFLMLGSL